MKTCLTKFFWSLLKNNKENIYRQFCLIQGELAEAFEAMYEEWLKEYTITEEEAWANIVMGSVG